MSIIHIPDSMLATKLANLSTNVLKCILIDISTYNRVTDTVATDTANHKTTVTINTADWTGSAIIDTTDGNKIIAVSDFEGTIASTGGTYSITDTGLHFTHF